MASYTIYLSISGCFQNHPVAGSNEIEIHIDFHCVMHVDRAKLHLALERTEIKIKGRQNENYI